MKVAVIGAGYVGCVSAACFARAGHDVTLVDSDAFKVEGLGAGRSPVLEPGLGERVAEMVAAGRLCATLPADAPLVAADVILVCVSTPSLRAGGVDTRPLQRVFAALGRVAL